ncbi:MAG: FliM/FliN family flagellar motor switch protein [Polyangiales bacterium]
MAVRPYPYERWPKLREQDVRLVRGVLRALSLDDGRAVSEARALLGADGRLSLAGAELITAAEAKARLRTPGLTLWLEHGAGRAASLLCEATPELGATIVDRVLGGDGRVAHPVGRSLDGVSTGVLGYFVARVLAAAGSSLRLRGVLGEPEQMGDLLGDEQVLVVQLDGELDAQPVFPLRVLCPASSAQVLASQPPGRAPVAPALQALPLQLCAHAARTALSLRELQQLAPGDVVVPEQCWLGRDGRAFAGPVELHVVGSHRARWSCEARGQTLTIETLIHDGEIAMTESKRIETQALELEPAALAGDAPIELCLTLARFTLPLQELSALRAGEVLSTGRAIGERASLCAGTRTIAHGELCEIDGEIGLRLTEIVGR